MIILNMKVMMIKVKTYQLKNILIKLHHTYIMKISQGKKIL